MWPQSGSSVPNIETAHMQVNQQLINSQDLHNHFLLKLHQVEMTNSLIKINKFHFGILNIGDLSID